LKNYWSLHVQEEGNNLVIEDGERIAYLGKKKPKKKLIKKKSKYGSSSTEQQPAQANSPPELPKLKKKQPSGDSPLS
jgi:hypothetical protein